MKANRFLLNSWKHWQFVLSAYFNFWWPFYALIHQIETGIMVFYVYTQCGTSMTIWADVCLDMFPFKSSIKDTLVQVNLCQKHLLFLHQLTHNMTTDCSLNYEFSRRKLQVQNMLCTQIVFECKQKKMRTWPK